ncbi:hypothetical protein [Neotabrizicola sp. sgz301269]|uniref:hypothetical protein n=1 Tax=Neotabrizicola sp. sgz301269 TaxID=3276282 RepID=UPI0037701502
MPLIVVVIENSDPIDLLDFTSSLTGLAREHEARLRAERPGIEPDETRLLIVEVRKGSIVLEMLPALAPIISTMEYTNTAANFVQHLAALVNPLRKQGGRLEDPTTAQLRNLNETVQSVVRDSDGALRVQARFKNGKVLQELIIEKEDAKVIEANVLEQRREIEAGKSVGYPRVLMRLHQSSVEDVRVGKKTSEKGIVESIDMVPRVLIYASDLAGQRIKDEIMKPDGNPFQKGFVIDLDVETVGGKPRVYRVLNVHDVVDLEDD